MSLEKKTKKRLIGYARVSRERQDLARQIRALKHLGCAVIYSDKASGKSTAGRPELARALDDLDTGDELVIAEWDRATRSMWDGLQIMKTAIDAGAGIKVLDRSYIDFETPIMSRSRDEYKKGAFGLSEDQTNRPRKLRAKYAERNGKILPSAARPPERLAVLARNMGSGPYTRSRSHAHYKAGDHALP
jgi:DNA invertase Pin-like site-specific DNA recombinase